MFCGSCGCPVVEGASSCIVCGKPVASAGSVQAAPFQAVPTPAASSFQAAAAAPALAPTHVATPALQLSGFGLAGMGERLGAAVLDMAVVVIIFAIAGMATASRLGGVTSSGFSLDGAPAALAIFLTSVLGFLYFWLAEGLFGATLGKAIAGIRVRAKDGQRCGLKASLLRNVLRIVDGIGVYLVGFIIAILSKTRQRLGDYVAGTVVVENAIAKPLRIFAAVLWVVVLAGGLTAAVIIHSGSPETITGVFTALPASIPMVSTGHLKAGNFAFTEGNGGPVRSNAVYKPGDRVFLKYDIGGYARDAKKAPHLIFLLNAADPSGIAVHAPWNTRFDGPVDIGNPVNGSLGLELPSFAPPGKYKIAINVHDEVAKSNIELTPAFEVNAPAVTPPRGLEFRDFELSRSASGPAEPVPSVETGATVYMGANVFGLQFRDGRTKGHMSLKILGPDGSVALDQPNYLDLSESQFYRPPTYWVHVRGEITIPPGLKTGVYTEQYAVMDDLSGQSITQEAKFEVK
jgi:uncharacterized RDD family membrane protein YckC